jgi:hypothetical protein
VLVNQTFSLDMKDMIPNFLEHFFLTKQIPHPLGHA